MDDVVKHLGVTPEDIFRRIERKRLPAHRVGRGWKWKLSEVDAWVRAGGADDTGQPASCSERVEEEEAAVADEGSLTPTQAAAVNTLVLFRLIRSRRLLQRLLAIGARGAPGKQSFTVVDYVGARDFIPDIFE